MAIAKVSRTLGRYTPRVGLSLVAAGALILFGLGTADAATVSEKDLNVAGDKLLTFDSLTGLEWLDLTETLGLNRDVVLAGSFVTTQGFRFASKSEVETLLNSFDIPTPFDGVFTAGKFAPVNTAVNFMGAMVSQQLHQGIYDEGSTLGLTILQVSGATAKANLTQGSSIAYSNNWGGYQGVGTYLVREAAVVPLPAAFPLFAGGLGLLGLLGWRRKRMVATAT